MSTPFDNEKRITAFLHCALCVQEWKDHKAVGESPASYARFEIGWTPQGLQVWCRRHNVNVLHVDFQGQTHPAILTRKGNPRS